MSNIELIDRLAADGGLSEEEFTGLLSSYTAADRDYAAAMAYRIARGQFGTQLRAWGVIDVTTNCSRDCFYCDLRRDNEAQERHRLSADDVLRCCAEGHELGIRTFVLQAAEDPEFGDDVADDLIWRVRKGYPDSAIALAFGERPRSVYQRYFDAGADRYLLRHETADAEHFAQLHPRRCTLANRIRCLEDLKSIGFETGCGMMVGTPYQTPLRLARDLRFVADFDPALVTIGPFLPAAGTRFADAPAGSLEKTLFVLSLVRILLPDAGLPVLTSLATAHSRGREMAVMAGADILMVDLTPPAVRAKSARRDDRLAPSGDPAEGLELLRRRMGAIGYTLASDRGERRRPSR